MAHIGVDLHQNAFTVCRLDADGTEAFETWQLCSADLDRFCRTLDADDEIAVEATGNSAWFREQVISCVGRVVTVNPSQFQVIRNRSRRPTATMPGPWPSSCRRTCCRKRARKPRLRANSLR